jgi:hypothetical protein
VEYHLYSTGHHVVEVMNPYFDDVFGDLTTMSNQDLQTYINRRVGIYMDTIRSSDDDSGLNVRKLKLDEPKKEDPYEIPVRKLDID